MASVEKYEKLLAMGMPKKQVRGKMEADGIDPSLLFVPNLTKYKKLVKMGMPKAKIIARMKKDSVDPSLLFGLDDKSPEQTDIAPATPIDTASQGESTKALAAVAANQNANPIEVDAAPPIAPSLDLPAQIVAAPPVAPSLDFPAQADEGSPVAPSMDLPARIDEAPSTPVQTTVRIDPPVSSSQSGEPTKALAEPSITQKSNEYTSRLHLDTTPQVPVDDGVNETTGSSEELFDFSRLQDLGISIGGIYYSVSELRTKVSTLKARREMLLERTAQARSREAAAEKALASAAETFASIQQSMEAQLVYYSHERKKRQQYIATVRTEGSAALQLEREEARWAEALAAKRRESEARVHLATERARHEAFKQSELTIAKRRRELSARLDSVRAQTLALEEKRRTLSLRLQSKREAIAEHRAQATADAGDRERRDQELSAKKEHDVEKLRIAREQFQGLAQPHQARALLDALRLEAWPYSEAAYAYCTTVAKKLQIRVQAQAIVRKRDGLKAKILLINTCLTDPESLLQHSSKILAPDLLAELKSARKAVERSDAAVSMTPGAKRVKQRAASARLRAAAKATVDALKRDRAVFTSQSEAAHAALLEAADKYESEFAERLPIASMDVFP